MRWNELGGEKCSVARTVSVIGDRWTLLILRDCFLRIRKFDEFEARLGITRHILADRLKKLVAEGVLKKVPYGNRPGNCSPGVIIAFPELEGVANT
jgi:DNA-binding HxlR family transcriptional regulator